MQWGAIVCICSTESTVQTDRDNDEWQRTKREKSENETRENSEKFREVVEQHASKSYDFSISDLLEQYMQGRLQPNFPEAAMVINSAGTVYSRKIDYLEALLMAMHDKQNEPIGPKNRMIQNKRKKTAEKKR